jgi:hypothetical protein
LSSSSPAFTFGLPESEHLIPPFGETEMIWIELFVALCAGGAVGCFALIMFVAGTRADRRRRQGQLPVVESVHIGAWHDDPYLAEVASRLRHSGADAEAP